ncbi:MAG: sigma-70 family RNA polymerase sigma factor [Verrucomicrobiota bacterium]
MTQTSQTRSTEADEALLRAFQQGRSESDFRALVEKYLGMVYGIALRRSGDPSLAEEISQNVFTILARKAGKLCGRPTLAGWIYRTTCIEAAEALRRRHAHQNKMKAYWNYRHCEANGQEPLREIMPLLDEAVAALPPADREIVLLRFFERKSFREIGAVLKKSDDACQKQTQRALEKIALILRRKGVALSTVALTSQLMAQWSQAAPQALAGIVARSALITAAQINAKLTILESIQLMIGSKTKSAMVVACLAALPLGYQWFQNHELREQIAQLQANLAEQKHAADSKASVRFGRIGNAHGSSLAIHSAPTASANDGSAGDAAGSFVEEWERALFEPDPVRRATMISSLLSRLTAANAPLAASAFERARKNAMPFGDEFRLFLRAWAKLDGSAALKHASHDAPQPAASAEVLAALAGWASTQPQAARAWIDMLPDYEHKEAIIYGLLDGWSMIDFESAAAYAESRPRSTSRDQFRELLLQRSLLTGGLPAAQQWFARIPDDDHNQLYKQRAFDEVIQAMLYRDPAAAAQWIAQQGMQPYLAGEAISTTAVKLAETSPVEALTWLKSLNGPASEVLGTGFSRTMEAWAARDINAAGHWLSQQADHPHYAEMAAPYAQAVAAVNPDTARAWANSIADEQRRADTLQAIEHGQQAKFKVNFETLFTRKLATVTGVESDALVEWMLGNKKRWIDAQAEQAFYNQSIQQSVELLDFDAAPSPNPNGDGQ